MSNKIFLSIVLAVLAIAGYVIYNNYNEDDAVEMNGDRVSFRCEDGSGFVAHFSADMRQINIIVAGEVAHSLNNTGDESVPYRFGDDARVYTFVGEEAVVTNLASNVSVVCNQPSDQGNAPYNFGDTGEGGGEEPDRAAAVAQNILGAWQSTDDEEFIREFRTSGVIIDSYADTEDVAGSWNIFTTDNEIETPFPQTPGAVYLRVVMSDFPEEILYFELATLTEEELELFYLGRGGVLKFTRVNSTRN